ncbi:MULTISPECIES: phasin family protein [Bradyrhizobium]|uniref:Phasin domain-containing protein n=1 Tax=Bradyrhizobium ottawaense TaxID=931866 RepID=A0ABV4FKA3_9BRAD|nr:MULTISPECIES: phasin family protein [Bradyrhizobium]MBR1290351.1 phasin family protein [Bradyrhizobium ottawaense]MDA9486351.1 Phasin protein [Bradyrhizobium sp. CCBAU 11445]PDT64557.1 Phasin protein [Bradyrhizobium ottawaense]WLB44752.1 phasin family protein [Bradyrhizobium ottawaense]WQN82050.1 phasin family protein [Bradyrhizobium ottawaense]
MANPRPEERSTQNMEDAARRTGERAAEQTTRIGQAAAEAGEEVARANADMLKQNVETLQQTWRSSLEAATSVMGRSSEQFSRTLGLSEEDAQKATAATERSARNAQTLLYSGTAAAKVMGGMSQEYLQKHIDHLNRLWTCRTPQDFAAVQSDMVRETVETALESSRRIADLSLKMADDTGKQIKKTMDQIPR